MYIAADTMTKPIFALLVMTSALVSSAAQAQGIPDETFGIQGATLLKQQGPTLGMTIDEGGSITIGGLQTSVGDTSFALTRILPNGAPDEAFGNQGAQYQGLRTISIPFPLEGSADYSYRGGFAPAPGGGYHLAATGVLADNSLASFVLKIRPDGTLDESYGDAGVLTELRGVTSLAALDDGRLVVTGQHASTGQSFMFRLLANGQRDPSFAGGQTLFFDTSNVPGGALSARHAVPAPGGDYVVVAEALSVAPPARRIVLVRVTQGGLRDWSFANGRGVLTTDTWRDEYHYGKSATVLADGKILTAGNSDSGCKVSRWTADGIKDETFGQAGDVIIAPDIPSVDGSPQPARCLDVLFTGEGAAYILGSASEMTSKTLVQTNFVAAISPATGALEPGFGQNGIGWPTYRPGSSASLSTRDPGGRIVVAGATHEVSLYASRLTVDALFSDNFEAAASQPTSTGR